MRCSILPSKSDTMRCGTTFCSRRAVVAPSAAMIMGQSGFGKYWRTKRSSIRDGPAPKIRTGLSCTFAFRASNVWDVSSTILARSFAAFVSVSRSIDNLLIIFSYQDVAAHFSYCIAIFSPLLLNPSLIDI